MSLTSQAALLELHKSLTNLQNRKGQLTKEMVETEVINLSCLEILKNRQNHNAHAITEKFIEAAQQIIPQYGEREALITRMGVPMNVQWDGMWEFLKNYFMSNHGINIDGDDSTESKIFYSTRHERYEFNNQVANTPADRTIDLLFTENRKVIIVNIQPTLSAKKGLLVESTGDKLVYRGSDPDYKFTVLFDQIDEVSKFILEMPNRSLRIEYFE